MNKEIHQYTFIEQLRKLSFVEEIWLFGSRARGDNNERSDIDLAILCPKAKDSDWLEIMNIVEKADTLLKVDCIKFSRENIDDELYKNILKDKKVIYMQNINYIDSFNALGNAINRLKDAVERNKLNQDDYMRDAAIHRFEFTIELFWKVLKKALQHEKVEATTPRDTLSKAYQYKMIDNDELWLKMLDDRNNTSHAYNESLAKAIFENIKSYVPVFEETYLKLKTRPNV